MAAMMDSSLTPTLIALAALGSGLGGMLRVWVVERVSRRWGDTFPWGTLVVNISGALLLGLLVGGAFALQDRTFTPAWLFLAIGLLGSYTTVSSFSLQTLSLWQARQAVPALINVLASLTGCLLAIGLGFSLALLIGGAA